MPAMAGRAERIVVVSVGDQPVAYSTGTKDLFSVRRLPPPPSERLGCRGAEVR